MNLGALFYGFYVHRENTAQLLQWLTKNQTEKNHCNNLV